MGKRKERRLAALSAAGRRVKLDLFAEPSGDLGGSPVHDGVGGILDQDHRAGIPNSPSSSGQRQENSLVLLGQYSDDELDDEANKRLKHAVVESSSSDHNEQVEEPATVECGDLERGEGEELVAQQVKQQDMENDYTPLDISKNLNGGESIENDAIVSGDDICNNLDSTKPSPVSGTCGIQIVGDVTSGWKMVMHEESNQYYYWNIESGETSWEVPSVLAQRTESTSEQKDPSVMEEMNNASMNACTSSPNLNGGLDALSNIPAIDGIKDACLVPESKGKYEHGLQIEKHNEEYKEEGQEVQDLGPCVNQTESKDSSSTSVLWCNISSPHDYVSSQRSNFALSSIKAPTTIGCGDKDEQPIMADEHHKAGIAHSSHLVEYGENLLLRLKALKGSESHPRGHDWMSKYILEINIRLSDFKSLLACGSSLLPFWVHSEAQLKRLEGAINEEISLYEKFEQLNESEIEHVSLCRSDNSLLQNMEKESEVDGKDQVVFSSLEKSNASPNSDTLTVFHKDAPEGSIDDAAGDVKHDFSSGSPTQQLGSRAEICVREDNKAVNPAELISKQGTEEDIDMDVDMEVDETPANHTSFGDASTTECFSPPQLIHSTSVECPSLPRADEFSAPPPPDEEWIPPLPPDDEPVPPPPPDELPAPSYPPFPPYSETVQPFPYTEQYNLVYPISNSNFEYYGPTITDVPSSDFQISEPQPPPYFETVPNAYSVAAVMVDPVGPVEPVVYYDLPNGTLPIGPVISGLEPSGFYSDSAHASYHDSATSGQMGSVEVLVEPGCSSLQSMNVESDASTLSRKTEMVTEQVPFNSATAQATSTILVAENAPAPSTTVAAPSTSAAKAQSKVLRSKKRTVSVAPTLRSNKKVSSLVDKWKAAKEELLEDEEDEPENAYEMLEKKRQKEIEEWRAQQIASGEAKDNANFQPLGGDWHERVKRKRARSTSEAAQTPPEASANENQQPNLIELSRNLPSGWQAYWDESSKEVYYGNVVTSETTWTRPAT